MFRGGALLPGATVASSGAGGGRGGLWPRATPANLIRVRTGGKPPHRGRARRALTGRAHPRRRARRPWR